MTKRHCDYSSLDSDYGGTSYFQCCLPQGHDGPHQDVRDLMHIAAEHESVGVFYSDALVCHADLTLVYDALKQQTPAVPYSIMFEFGNALDRMRAWLDRWQAHLDGRDQAQGSPTRGEA